MLDIKITGGDVLDGTGSPAVHCDVGITGDLITDMGDLSQADARLTLDVSGRLVCPGFIDAHSHSDTYVFLQPSADSKIFQGITTEVVGNCGASAAPRYPGAHMPTDWREKQYPCTWSTVADYRTQVDRIRPATNVALLIGHNTLRTGLSGYENRPLTADELREACRRLEQALDEGGRGVSTGLIYAPGMFAPRDEIVALARVAGRKGGVYASHMRSEGSGLLNSIREMIDIGRAAGCRIEISHLKTSGKSHWPLLDPALELISTARAEGLSIAADRYPYTSGCTDLDAVFPYWAEEGGRDAVLARLRDPAIRKRLRDDMAASRPADAWAWVVIGSTDHPDNKRFQGVGLMEASRVLGMDPVDAILHFAETDGLRTSAFFFGMSEDNMRRILSTPFVMFGTDASIRALEGVLGQDYPHPRAYGSVPVFLRMVLDQSLIPLPEAIRKMTSLPAAQFGLSDRGVLARGRKADVVVLDLPRLAARSDYGHPHGLAEGVDPVIVNGVLTLRGGRLTGERGGRFV